VAIVSSIYPAVKFLHSKQEAGGSQRREIVDNLTDLRKVQLLLNLTDDQVNTTVDHASAKKKSNRIRKPDQIQ